MPEKAVIDIRKRGLKVLHELKPQEMTGEVVNEVKNQFSKNASALEAFGFILRKRPDHATESNIYSVRRRLTNRRYEIRVAALRVLGEAVQADAKHASETNAVAAAVKLGDPHREVADQAKALIYTIASKNPGAVTEKLARSVIFHLDVVHTNPAWGEIFWHFVNNHPDSVTSGVVRHLTKFYKHKSPEVSKQAMQAFAQMISQLPRHANEENALRLAEHLAAEEGRLVDNALYALTGLMRINPLAISDNVVLKALEHIGEGRLNNSNVTPFLYAAARTRPEAFTPKAAAAFDKLLKLKRADLKIRAIQIFEGLAPIVPRIATPEVRETLRTQALSSDKNVSGAAQKALEAVDELPKEESKPAREKNVTRTPRPLGPRPSTWLQLKGRANSFRDFKGEFEPSVHGVRLRELLNRAEKASDREIDLAISRDVVPVLLTVADRVKASDDLRVEPLKKLLEEKKATLERIARIKARPSAAVTGRG
jgi:hypothetical protein